MRATLCSSPPDRFWTWGGGGSGSQCPGWLSGATSRPISYFLVNDALDLHGLHDVGDELGVGVGVSDLVVEQSSDGALEKHTHTHTDVGLKKIQTDDHKPRQFNRRNGETHPELGADGLRLKADVENGDVT